MDLSGIIFAVLAMAWALYLIPKALKHHDEIARTRSIDRFSTAMRVLARREPVNRRDTRLVVTARPPGTPRVLLPAASAAIAAGSDATSPAAQVRRPTAARTAAVRMAARAAARRRRHIAIFALLSTGITAGVAGFGYLPLSSVAAPLALTFCYLYVCRRQVRREQETSWTPQVEAPRTGTAASTVSARRAIRVDAPYGTPLAPRGHDEISPNEGAVAPSGTAAAEVQSAGSAQEADLAARLALEVETVAVVVPTTDGGSIWDPLPVTLPTYVSKPRAPRTVRTIDLLGDLDTWTSGRSEADSALVAETPKSTEEEASFEQDEQRAVGS